MWSRPSLSPRRSAVSAASVAPEAPGDGQTETETDGRVGDGRRQTVGRTETNRPPPEDRVTAASDLFCGVTGRAWSPNDHMAVRLTTDGLMPHGPRGPVIAVVSWSLWSSGPLVQTRAEHPIHCPC